MANSASNNDSEDIILVVCALAEEATGFEEVLNRNNIKIISEENNKSEYNFERYKIIIVWGSQPGYIAYLDLINFWLPKIKKQSTSIKLLVMTGICAGLKKETKLGDIVVADLVYEYSIDRKTTKDRQLFNVRNQIPLAPEINHWVAKKASEQEIPEKQKKILEYIPPNKPPTRDHIKEHTLSLLRNGQSEKQIIEKIKDKFNADYHDTIGKVVRLEINYLKKQKYLKKQNYIQETENTSYTFTEEGETYFNNLEDHANQFDREFPYTDSKFPRLIVGELACGPDVRKDEYGETLVQLAGFRKTVAIDMESFTIMKTGRDENIPTCVVKSVCDYGDNEKNDDYHSYAAQTSAAFVLFMIRDYLQKIGKSDAASGTLNNQQCAIR